MYDNNITIIPKLYHNVEMIKQFSNGNLGNERYQYNMPVLWRYYSNDNGDSGEIVVVIKKVIFCLDYSHLLHTISV